MKIKQEFWELIKNKEKTIELRKLSKLDGLIYGANGDIDEKGWELGNLLLEKDWILLIMFREIICDHCKEKILVTKDNEIKEYEEKIINYITEEKLTICALEDNYINAELLINKIKNGDFR